jgi:catechol 2,3-dioxygenase-like lactoylglutathione lyase family enzyme
MELGAFSISLSVKDLATSREFYERLGFSVFHDASAQGYLILQNETSTVGLFQGMFDGNILTYNPGWDRYAQAVSPFDDVRDIQRELDGAGVTIRSRADEDSSGPASITLEDPDGNIILIDQHVPRPNA